MLNLQKKNKGKIVETIACDKCKCTWLFEVKVNRFSTNPQSLAMSAPSIHFEGDFNLLQCAACGTVVFPPLEGFQTASSGRTLYDEMVEEIAGSKDEAEKRLAGTQVDKYAKGAWSHILEKENPDR